MNGIDLALLIEVQGIALRFDAVATILNQAATFSSVATVLPREDFGEEKTPHPLKALGCRGEKLRRRWDLNSNRTPAAA
ncbi:hypothetical protein QN367_12150 [Cryobacterium sp. RTS3]|nr:hypothetical protein [Cryobacterium sp. RTS3]